MIASPLGKYGQLVAALVATAIIAVDLWLHATGAPPDAFIDNLAFAAFGAVFGATATTAVTNGTLGREVAALHARQDALAATVTAHTGPDQAGSTSP